MKRKIFSVLFALVLALSFSLVAAVPAGADPGYVGYKLGAATGASATWDTEKNTSATTGYLEALGSYSVKLDQGATAGETYVECTAAGGLTLDDLATIGETSFYYILSNDDIYLDLIFSDPNSDGYVDIALQYTPTELSGTYDGNWHKMTVDKSSDFAFYNGFTPGTVWFDAWSDDWSTGTLANILSRINSNTLMTDEAASAADWELTAVRGQVYQGNSQDAYIDNITIDGVTYELEPAKFLNASDAEIQTVPSVGSFYLMLDSVGPWWNTSEFAQDTGQMTLKVYRVYDPDITLISTNTYTATESGNDTARFRTDAISGADLGLEPGYKLVASVAGASYNTAYAQAEISFDKVYYDVGEPMTITVKDDTANINTAAIDDLSTLSGDTAVAIVGGADEEIILGNFQETGADTGVFQYAAKKPSDFGFTTGQTMTLYFQNAEFPTTAGTAIDEWNHSGPAAGTDTIYEVKATAGVLMYSESLVAFNQGTYAVTDTSATITVTDTDKDTDGKTNTDTITGANCLVVENLTTGDSVSFDTIAESTTTAGEFEADVTFGTGTDELVINDGDSLKATYSDPATPEDVSTATAAVGYTVFLYDDTGALDDSYTTIQAAIDAAAGTGWTVKVSEAYNSTDESSFPITINQNNLTVESIAGAASTTIDASAESAGAVEITADDVTFDGFTVKSGTKGIKTTGDRTILQNNIVTKETGAVVMGIEVSGGASGVMVTGNELDINNTMNVVGGSSHCTLSDNTFGAGINLDGTDDITITGNTITGSELTGIDFGTGGSFTNIMIKGNTISETTLAPGTGIRVRGAAVTNVTVVGNDIKDNAGSPLSVSGGHADKVHLVFNNITGNATGVSNADTTNPLNAKHNWWGTADGPSATDTTGAGTTTTTFYLTAPVKLTAEYMEQTAATSLTLDAHLTAGVKVAASIADKLEYAGVAEYTESPKAAMADASFYDAFLDTSAALAGDTVTIKFYTPEITADSVAYFWNSLAEEWQACSNQGYSSYTGYVWVQAKDETIEVPTYPTIQDLVGGEFAISTEEAPPEFDPMDYDADGDGAISKSEALTSVTDYFAGEITKAQALEVIALYFAS